MTMHPFKNKVLRSVVFSLSMVVALLAAGALAVGCAEDSEAKQGEEEQVSATPGSLVDTIIVSGRGKVTTLPDEAILWVAVENDAATAAEALDANSKDTQSLLERLKAEGVAAEAIETANVVVYPNYYYDEKTGEQKITGYRAQNMITVTFTDLTRIAEVYAAAVEAGADNVSGPAWQLSEDNAATTTALTKAIANARLKAEAIAADQGVGLGEALIINETSASTPYPLTYAGAAAETARDSAVTPPPLSPESIEVSASVTVTFRMNR